MNNKEIEDVLKELGVEKYTVFDDGTVDVNGTVDISFKNLERIPVQFGIVKGDFNCSNNKLNSLNGAPQAVGNSFFCHKNHLTSLAGAPQTVGKAFVCSNNDLTSLTGAPPTINGVFDCSGNKLVSLKGGPDFVDGKFDSSNNQLTTLEGIPKFVRIVLYCSGNPIPDDVMRDYREKTLFLIIGDEEK